MRSQNQVLHPVLATQREPKRGSLMRLCCISILNVRADGGLVDKHQPGRIKHTLLSYPAAARSRHICSLPFGCLQHFF